MEVITLKDFNGVSHEFEVTEHRCEDFGVDNIYAVAVFYTGHIIYNTSFNADKYEKKIVLTD